VSLPSLSLTLDVLQRRFQNKFHLEILPPLLSPWLTLADSFSSSCPYLSAMKLADAIHLCSEVKRASNVSLSSIFLSTEKSFLDLTNALIHFIPHALSTTSSQPAALVVDPKDLLPLGWNLPSLLPLIMAELIRGREQRGVMNDFIQSLVSHLLTSHPLDLILQFLSALLTSSLLTLFIENQDLLAIQQQQREPLSSSSLPRLLLEATVNSFRNELLLYEEGNISDYLFTNYIEKDLKECSFPSVFILEMQAFLNCCFL
jgi:hypothetical protein